MCALFPPGEPGFYSTCTCCNSCGPKLLDSLTLTICLPGTRADVEVDNVRRPTHFSGHVGVELNDGTTLLAAGISDR
ncbi:MAG: hypothetical protein V3T86_12710 [Planctomycetota bacterium]